MTTRIFRPAAIAVQKKVIMGCRSAQAATRLASAEVQFGCGFARVTVDGWTAAAAIAAWNDTDHPVLSNIAISAYTASGWYQAVLFTSNTRGDDFRINFLVDDEVELVVDEVHTATLAGRTGSIDILFHTPIGDLSISSLSITGLSNIALEAALQEAITDIPGIEVGDITAHVSGTTPAVTIDFLFSGKFAGSTLELTEIDTTDLFRPTTTQPTLEVLQLGSTGSDHKVELHFTVQPVYEYSNEVQELSASTTPIPSTGTFTLDLDTYTSAPTAAIAYNASAAVIASALNAVGLTSAEVTVTGGPLPENPIYFTFIGSYAGEDIPLFTVDDSGLELIGATPDATVTEYRKGVAPGAGVNAKHLVSIPATVSTGTFTLTYTKGTTATINYNSSTGAFDTAVEGVLGAGTITATGSLPGGITLEYTGAMGLQAVALPTGNGTLLGNGKSISTETLESPEVTSTWRSIDLLGGNDFTVTLTAQSNSAIGLVGDIDDTCTLPFTWVNPWRSPSNPQATLSISIRHGSTIREIWDQIRDAENAFVAANTDALDERMRGPTIVPYLALDIVTGGIAYGDRRFGEDDYPFQFKALLSLVNYAAAGEPKPFTFDATSWLNTSGTVVGQVIKSGNYQTFSTVDGNGYRDWGGTCKFGYLGEFTDPITLATATPDSVQAAIEALSTVGTGNIRVRQLGFGSTASSLVCASGFLVYEFIGDLSGIAAGLLSFTNVNITFYKDTSTGLEFISAVNSVPYFSASGYYNRGGTASGQTVQIAEYIPSAPAQGSIVWSIDGFASTAKTTYAPANTQVISALNAIVGTTGKISISGGPLLSAPITVTYNASLGAIGDLTASYSPDYAVSVSSSVTGLAPGIGVDEQQLITLTNTTGGTFTISDGTNTTGNIAWNASSAAVLSALGAATPGPIEAGSVVGVPGSYWTITFDGALGESDIALVTVDDGDLTNTISPQPYLSIDTIIPGGVGTIVGGLFGGTFDLRLTRTVDTIDTVFYVRSLAFNISNAALKTAIEAVIGETIVITGGQLPGTDVQIEFTDVVGTTHWLVEVIPNLRIEGGSSGTLDIVRSAVNHPPENVWDLEIVPGTDTPGIRDSSKPDDWGYLILKIETPEGTLSSDAPPQSPVTGEEEKTRQPSLVKIRWIDLTAEMLEETINEAMGEIVCRVVQPIQSIEHADFTVTIPVPSGVGSVETRVKCWYMRSVFRVIFCGDFQAADSISNITVQLPLRDDGQVVDVRDFMVIDDNTPSQDTEASTFEDVMGEDRWDAAKESSRIAGAFYLAQLGGEPLHSFGIYRSGAEGILTWRFKLLDHYVISYPEWESERFGVADHRPCTVRFHWAQRSTNESTLQHSYRILASSEALPHDASVEQIKSALSTILPGWFGSDNLRVLGSLYNSYTSDTFDPAIGVSEEAPSNLGFTGLQVSLIGDLLYQPFNEFNLNLIMSIELRDSTASTPVPLMFYRTSGSGVSRENMEDMPLIHFESLADCPIPLQVNKRIRLSPEGPGPYSLSVNGTPILLNADDTEDDIEAAFVTAFGSLPYGTSALLPTYTWDSQTFTYEKETRSTYRTWMPERFAKPATVFGSLPGPIEIEFSGMGLQYTNVTVAIGPDEYESDPIEVTVLVQGEGAQSTIWLLTIPSDAIDGTFTLDGNVYDIPLSGSLASLESYLDSEYATVTTSTSGTETTITFDGTGSYSPASFASAALRAATCTVVVSTTGGIDGTLVLYDLVGGAGPKWFFSSQNWDGNTVPTLNDELILDDASGDVKYGIDLVHQFLPYSSTRLIWTDRVNRFRSGQRIVIDHTDMDGSFYVRDALPDGTFALSTTANGDLVEFDTFEEGTGAFKASLEVSARYSGNIGLAEYVGALPEYLPKYLSMYYVSLDLGNGTGDGLSLGRFDLSTFATSVNIHKSGDADVYSAILLLVNSADTVIAATNASVGIGEILGETCLFDTFEGTAVELVIGRNTSYISVHNSGSTKHLAADRYFT